jgi:hypothetical protein
VNIPRIQDDGRFMFWAMNDFNPHDVLPAGLWRYSPVVELIVGMVASGPAVSACCRKDRQGLVPLQHKTMDFIMGSDGKWTRVRRELLEKRVLLTDGHYLRGHSAMRYGIGQEFRDREFHLAEVTDRRLLKRMKSLEVGHAGLSPAQGHLDRWLRKVRVDEAETWRFTCKPAKCPSHRFTAARIRVIQSGHAGIVVDPYGRVHSPITNLRRACRPALRVDGHRLAEFDVKSSQPLILAYLAGKILAGDWSVEEVQRLGARGPINHPFNGLELTRWSTRPPRDVLGFLELCQDGRFYASMARAWKLPFSTSQQVRRVKVLAFKLLLFGPVRHGNCHWEEFKHEWPGVASAIEQVKERDHGTLARACQRIESRLMIGGVVEQLRIHQPDMPVQTIHDSVLVLDEPGARAQAIRLVMGEYAGIGLTPKIRIA